MRTAKLAFMAFMLFAPAGISAAQNGIASRIGRIADSLAAGYGKSAAPLEKPAAAVFTFSTAKDLEKQRIGFAVSEMLSHQLAKTGLFQLLERAELNRVLGELKLSMSGAVDQDEALNAGKLASADLLVLGSVEKIGRSYHVNARLVASGTGEVLATAYESLPSSEFESEARDYVVLAPQTQTIGIYFLGSYRVMGDLPPTTRTYSAGWVSYVTTEPENAKLVLPGIGLRYYPFEHFFVDASYINAGEPKRVGNRKSDFAFYAGPYTAKFSLGRVLIGPRTRLGSAVYGYAGGGVTMVSVKGSGYASYTTPTFMAGVEFRPQQRIGITLSAGYDLKSETAIGDLWGAGDQPFNIVRLPHFYIEPSLALYF